jgi:hypothetical protein
MTASRSPHASRLAGAVPVALLLLVVSACSGCLGLGDCYDSGPERISSGTCDGETVVVVSYREGNDGARCQEETSRTNCAESKLTCATLPGWGQPSCVRECTTDADCDPRARCTEGETTDGHRLCGAPW